MAEHEIEVDLGAGRRQRVPVDVRGNSNRERAGKKTDPPEREKLEPIVTGTVVKRKKSLWTRFGNSMTQDTTESVLQYVVMESLLPALKNMILDAINTGSERLLFGDSSPVKSRNDTPYGYTSYNRITTARRKPAYNEITRRGRASHDFDEVILASRGNAEDILDRMRELIAQFDVATVADFYDLVGITSDFPDDTWGWTDLRHAMVRHVRGGYLIALPKAQLIE